MQQPFLFSKLRRCHAGLDYMRQDTHTYGRGKDTRGLHYKQQQKRDKKVQKNHRRRTNRIKQVLKRTTHWHNNTNTRTKRKSKGSTPMRNTNTRRAAMHIYNTGIYRNKQPHDKGHPWQTLGIRHRHKNRTRGKDPHTGERTRATGPWYKGTTSQNRAKRGEKMLHVKRRGKVGSDGERVNTDHEDKQKNIFFIKWYWQHWNKKTSGPYAYMRILQTDTQVQKHYSL